MSHGPKALSDPNIYVPPSSIPMWYDLGRKAHTNIETWIGPAQIHHEPTPVAFNLHGPLLPQGPVGGYYPSDIHHAYQVPPIGGAGAIAIIDAFHFPTALNDFNVFSSQFGLPVESSTNATSNTNSVFQVVYQTPGTPPPVNLGWTIEESLDIEWAHAMAPNAKVYLVEANDNSYANLLAAEQIGAMLPGVTQCSNSWGGFESPAELSYDSTFTQPNVEYFVSSGDDSFQEYPSESPNVIGVGGTSLYMSGSTVLAETAWDQAGGGPSAYEPLPSFQQGISLLTGASPQVRGCPDIAAVADPNTGAALYNSSFGWFIEGGTSLACPVCAGIFNNLGENQSSSDALLNQIYSEIGTSYFRDIVAGTNGFYSAGPGYDFVTGVGVPLGGYVAPTLAIPAQVKATAGGTISYTYQATSARRPAASVSAVKTAGPTWITYSGSTLTITPPANIRLGDYPVTITATDNGTPPLTTQAGFLVHVANCGLQNILFPSAVLASGSTANLTVNLTSPAPAGGVTVNFTTTNPLLTVPATLAFAQGQTTGTIQVSSTAINSQAIVFVIGSLNGTTYRAGVRLVSPAPSAVSVTGGVISGASTQTGTVMLGVAAPTGGVSVRLSSSLPGVVSVPALITIPAGQTSAHFTVTTYAPGVQQIATVTASTAGGSATTHVTVNP